MVDKGVPAGQFAFQSSPGNFIDMCLFYQVCSKLKKGPEFEFPGGHCGDVVSSVAS